jgi:hypothetical protein
MISGVMSLVEKGMIGVEISFKQDLNISQTTNGSKFSKPVEYDDS